MARARRMDEEEREIRRKQEEEREALRRKISEEQVTATDGAGLHFHRASRPPHTFALECDRPRRNRSQQLATRQCAGGAIYRVALEPFRPLYIAACMTERELYLILLEDLYLLFPRVSKIIRPTLGLAESPLH